MSFTERSHPALLGWALALALTVWFQSLSAASGDVLGVSNALLGKDLSAITLDTSSSPPGGSFWALDKTKGKIYHLTLDLNTVLGEIQNPHGTGQFPNPILSWGIAYRPLTRTLFVLAKNGSNWKVREVQTDGVELPSGAFTITVPDFPVGDLRSLSYDSVAREFWYLDGYNDRLVRTGLNGIATRVCPLVGDVPLETTIRGDGACFDLTEIAPGVFEQRVFVAYGDIFAKNPSRIIQMNDSCEETGIEIPLGKLTLPGIPQGFQTFRAGAQRRLAIVMSTGKIAQLELSVPQTVPPSQIQCSLTLTNKVLLSWVNHGSLGPSHAYGGEIVVLRNGVPFKTLGGSSVEFIDQTPLVGTSTYSLRSSATVGGTLSPVSSACQVTVGASGIVRWIPFPGAAPFDVARDPSTGDLFVTDDVGLGSEQGKIYHFDSALREKGEITSPWDRPGPITFIPSITIGEITLTEVLAVGRTDGALVKLIDLGGNEKTTFVLEGCTRMGGLSYNQFREEFTCIDADSGTISIADATGRSLSQCRPHEIPLQNLPEVDLGITFDPIQGTFLTAFKDGIVRELFTGGSCLPTRPVFEISLASLGEGYNEPGFAAGVQIAANTLVVCGRKSRALFQVLIFPASPPFRRGDFDRNDQVNLTDAVAAARYLFMSGPAPNCPDSADMNDDGVLDVSDPVYLLFHLFLQGPSPPPPFPGSGNDPTFRDNLGCEEV